MSRKACSSTTSTSLQAFVPELQQRLPRLLFAAVDRFPLANGDGLDGLDVPVIILAVRSLPCSERLDHDTKEVVKATAAGESKPNPVKRQLHLSWKSNDGAEVPVVVSWHDAHDFTRLALKGAPSCTEAIAISADPSVDCEIDQMIPLYCSSEWITLCGSIRQEAFALVCQKPYLAACVGPAQAVLYKAQKNGLTKLNEVQVYILAGLCRRVVMRCGGSEKFTDTVQEAMSSPQELSMEAWRIVVDECKGQALASSQCSIPAGAMKDWVKSLRDSDYSMFAEVCCKSVKDPLPPEASIPPGAEWEGLLENAVPAGAELIFATQVGSFMYDLQVAASDKDFAILFLADAKDLLAPQPPRMEFQHHVNLGFGAEKQGLMEYTSREFGSFCADLAKGNPRNVELLFTDKPHARNWVWDELRARRKEFLTIHCARQYLGFIQDRLKRLLKECDDAAGFGEEHAARASKLLYHAHHRILELRRIVRGGEPLVALVNDERDHVMRFRLQRPRNAEEARNLHREADQIWQQLRAEVDAAEEKATLPMEVDAESLLAWLCSVRTRAIAWQRAGPAGSLDGVCVKENANSANFQSKSHMGYEGPVVPVADHSVSRATNSSAEKEETAGEVEAIDAVVSDAIKALLERIEAMESVRILWAGYGLCSRTLGTVHANSDHDVKAIFVHHESRYFGLKPLAHALRHKFPIDLEVGQVEVDISGWEARHLCQLLSKSNPTVIAALHSPVVFRSSVWVERLLALQQATVSWAAVSTSWRNHARGNYRQNILAVEAPPRKKYIHVLQALLCLEWLKSRSSAGSRDLLWPPLKISVLLDEIIKDGLLSDVESASVSSLIRARENLAQALPHDKVLDSLIERLLASSELGEPLRIPMMQRQRSPVTDWDELCSAMVSETSKF